MTALLHPHRGSATKTIGPNGVVCDYAAGGKFVGRNITIPLDVTALADWLRIQTKRDEFLIAGAIRDGRGDMRTLINRRYLERAGWARPDIIDVPQTVLIIDCDGAPGSCDFRVDPVATAASVRDMIPELKGVACVFVGSSRAGTNTLARGKFFFILSAPKRAPELRAWAEDANQRTGRKVADPGLYNPVQPIYLATPRFVDEMADPMPERVLVLPGDERPIALPELALRPHTQLVLGGDASHAHTPKSCAAPSVNDDLGGGMLDMPTDAVRFLTRKGHFNKDENKHWNMVLLAFACAYAEIMREAPAADVRALYFEVVAATGRDRDDNEARYDDALRRTPALIGAGARIVTLGTIIHWATDQGWASPNETAGAQPMPFATPQAIELAIVKAKAVDAYKLGRLKSREQARVLLARFCKTVDDANVRRELAKTVAGVLAQDGWGLCTIADAGTFLGLEPPAAASLAHWAIRKLSTGATP